MVYGIVTRVCFRQMEKEDGGGRERDGFRILRLSDPRDVEKEVKGKEGNEREDAGRDSRQPQAFSGVFVRVAHLLKWQGHRQLRHQLSSTPLGAYNTPRKPNVTITKDARPRVTSPRGSVAGPNETGVGILRFTDSAFTFEDALCRLGPQTAVRLYGFASLMNLNPARFDFFNVSQKHTRSCFSGKR